MYASAGERVRSRTTVHARSVANSLARAPTIRPARSHGQGARRSAPRPHEEARVVRAARHEPQQLGDPHGQQGERSVRLSVATNMSPPARSNAAAPASRRARSCTCSTTSASRTTSNAPSASGGRVASATHELGARAARARGEEAAQPEVDADDAGAALGERQRQQPASAAEVADVDAGEARPEPLEQHRELEAAHRAQRAEHRDASSHHSAAWRS
jgi:hypothetical protein